MGRVTSERLWLAGTDLVLCGLHLPLHSLPVPPRQAGQPRRLAHWFERSTYLHSALPVRGIHSGALASVVHIVSLAFLRGPMAPPTPMVFQHHFLRTAPSVVPVQASLPSGKFLKVGVVESFLSAVVVLESCLQ